MVVSLDALLLCRCGLCCRLCHACDLYCIDASVEFVMDTFSEAEGTSPFTAVCVEASLAMPATGVFETSLTITVSASDGTAGEQRKR